MTTYARTFTAAQLAALKIELAEKIDLVSSLNSCIYAAGNELYYSADSLTDEQKSALQIDSAHMTTQKNETLAAIKNLRKLIKSAVVVEVEPPAPVLVNLPHGDQYLLPGLEPVDAPAVQLSLF